MSYAHFTEGGPPPEGAPYELLSAGPESPVPFHAEPEGGKAMLVYAHPDDEMLFAGGLMLRFPHWEWTLVCVTDPGRDEMQERAIALLREHKVNIKEHVNLGFTDGFHPSAEFRYELACDVKALVEVHEPDITFTHGYRGEYGHHMHHWTHLATHLAADNVWDFLWPNTRVKQLRKTLVREVAVDRRKLDILTDAYRELWFGGLNRLPWIGYHISCERPEFFTQGVVGL